MTLRASAPRVAAGDAADVERGEEQPLRDRLRLALGPRQPEFAAQPGVDVRDRFQGRALFVADGVGRVVPAVDQHVPVFVLHRRQEVREDAAGVGRPVPVVAGVQVARGPVHRHLHPHRAAHPEGQLRPPALVRGAIEEEPDVDLVELFGPHFHVAAQIARTRLLLAVEEEHQVRGGRHALLPKRVQYGKHRRDGRLVVAGGTRVDAPVRVDGLAGLGHRHGFAARLHRGRVQGGLEGRMGPVARIHRLPVVVHVDAERARGAGRVQLAVDEWRHAVEGEQLRFGTRFAQAVTDVERCPGDVVGVAGAVRVGQQLGEVADDLGLVAPSVRLREVGTGLGGEGGRGGRGTARKARLRRTRPAGDGLKATWLRSALLFDETVDVALQHLDRQ